MRSKENEVFCFEIMPGEYKGDTPFVACVGGCVGGAGVLTHTDKNRVAIDKYGEKARFKTISESLSEDN
jgi:hypothetical protein